MSLGNGKGEDRKGKEDYITKDLNLRVIVSSQDNEDGRLETVHLVDVKSGERYAYRQVQLYSVDGNGALEARAEDVEGALRGLMVDAFLLTEHMSSRIRIEDLGYFACLQEAHPNGAKSPLVNNCPRVYDSSEPESRKFAHLCYMNPNC